MRSKKTQRRKSVHQPFYASTPLGSTTTLKVDIGSPSSNNVWKSESGMKYYALFQVYCTFPIVVLITIFKLSTSL
jgi:hypothetical protein